MSSNDLPSLPLLFGISRAQLRRALGQRLEDLREHAELSQQALADALGVDRGTVSRWERGVTLPSLERLAGLATTFEMSLEQLLAQRTTPPALAQRSRQPSTEKEGSV